MSIQGNLIKLKKAVKNNRKVYLIYGNRDRVEGKIESIGNLFVYILSDKQDEPVMVEIEKIQEISLIRGVKG
jgi:ribosome maturation factor RimP